MNQRFQISGKLNAFDQLAILRKLTPSIPMISLQIVDENKDKDMKILMSIALSRLDDDDSDFVVKKCLSVVSVNDGSRNYPLMNKGVLMYQDIELADILDITAEVIKDNLGNFLNTALPKYQDQVQE